MDRKKFVVSLKDRVYLNGIHLADQDVAEIHKMQKELNERFISLSEKEVIDSIAGKMKLDRRTVIKYMNNNSIVLVGGRRRRHNEIITDMIKVSPIIKIEHCKKDS